MPRPYSRLPAETKREIAFEIALGLISSGGLRLGLDRIYRICDRVAGRKVRISRRTEEALRKAGRERHRLEMRMFAAGVADLA